MDKVKFGILAGTKLDFEEAIGIADPDLYIFINKLEDVPEKLTHFMTVGKHVDGKDDKLDGKRNSIEAACRKATIKWEEEVVKSREDYVSDKHGYTAKDRKDGKPQADKKIIQDEKERKSNENER